MFVNFFLVEQTPGKNDNKREKETKETRLLNKKQNARNRQLNV